MAEQAELVAVVAEKPELVAVMAVECSEQRTIGNNSSTSHCDDEPNPPFAETECPEWVPIERLLKIKLDIAFQLIF